VCVINSLPPLNHNQAKGVSIPGLSSYIVDRSKHLMRRVSGQILAPPIHGMFMHEFCCTLADNFHQFSGVHCRLCVYILSCVICVNGYIDLVVCYITYVLIN